MELSEPSVDLVWSLHEVYFFYHTVSMSSKIFVLLTINMFVIVANVVINSSSHVHIYVVMNLLLFSILN